MKNIPLLLPFLCLLLSCNSEKPGNTLPSFVASDSCRLNPHHTYEVYIPARNKNAEQLPLLVILDPHGSGKFALEKFKASADQYPAVLVASNLVKNNFEKYQEAIETLVADVRKKYPVGEMLFMSGFSGGARMALGYALGHQVDGLILCGAMASKEQLNALPCSLVSISGTDDFNFVETAQYLFGDLPGSAKLTIELTNASHAWPDSRILASSFAFLRFSCRSLKLPPPAKSELKNFCSYQHTRIDSMKLQGDFLKATLLARNMSANEPFIRDKSFASEYAELRINSDYLNQLQRLQKSLNFEISLRQPYLDAFHSRDTLWWKNEIRKVDEKIKTEKDSFSRDAYIRIKAFWGIASYSLCNQAIIQHDADALEKILSIYRTLEPENPDMLYFSTFPARWKEELTLPPAAPVN